MKKLLLLALLLTTSFYRLGATGCSNSSKGKLVTDFPMNSKNTSTVGVQQDGKPIIARIKQTLEEGTEVNSVTLERFLCNGQKDTQFGENGSLKSDIHPTIPKRMMQITKEGKLILAGSDGVRLHRYTEDGDLDNTFGDEGKVEGAFTLKDDRELKNETIVIRLQNEGKILVAGNAARSLPPYNVLYFMARFNADGSIDKTFGSGGKIIEGESEKSTPELAVENVLTDSEGTIFLVGYGINVQNKKSLVMHKFDKNGLHIKGPVSFSPPESPQSRFYIVDALLPSDSELVFLGKMLDSDSNTASLMLLKFNADLEHDSRFGFEPRRGLASGNYEANGIGTVPGGFVLAAEFQALEDRKNTERQIIKVNNSGKELIRVADTKVESMSELPLSLLQQPSGKYSLLGSSTGSFNVDGLEYILLKFMP